LPFYPAVPGLRINTTLCQLEVGVSRCKAILECQKTLFYQIPRDDRDSERQRNSDCNRAEPQYNLGGHRKVNCHFGGRSIQIFGNRQVKDIDGITIFAKGAERWSSQFSAQPCRRTGSGDPDHSCVQKSEASVPGRFHRRAEITRASLYKQADEYQYRGPGDDISDPGCDRRSPFCISHNDCDQAAHCQRIDSERRQSV